MLVAEEITRTSPAYIKRRIMWKAVNRARNSFARPMFLMWKRQMRKSLGGDIMAIREAMKITFVRVGGAFARYHNNKLTKARGAFDDQMAGYANSEMSSISASIGETLQQKAAKIRANPDLTGDEQEDLIEEMINSRAKIVSDNEVTRASNVGAEIGAMAAILSVPEPFIKTWLATIDDRVRDGHEAAEGLTVRESESFIVGGEALRVPMDSAGSIANTINCRCAVDYQKVINN